jgi:hypothetical protein
MSLIHPTPFTPLPLSLPLAAASSRRNCSPLPLATLIPLSYRRWRHPCRDSLRITVPCLPGMHSNLPAFVSLYCINTITEHPSLDSQFVHILLINPVSSYPVGLYAGYSGSFDDRWGTNGFLCRKRYYPWFHMTKKEGITSHFYQLFLSSPHLTSPHMVWIG